MTQHINTGILKSRQALSKFLLYRCSGVRFASELTSIREAIQSLKIEESPLRLDNTLGVSSLRGEIITIRSLSQLIWGRTSSLEDYTIILERNKIREGWQIERIEKVLQVDPENIKTGQSSDGAEARIVNRYIETPDEIINILDLQNLWAA